MTKQQLLAMFEDMLPASLGKPYIMNTAHKPYVFVAFYDSQSHEMKDGRILIGCEFRLWEATLGIQKRKPLAGIIGFNSQTYDLVLTALTNEVTKGTDLHGYKKMLVEMMGEIDRQQQK
jgi:hypothetical protein